MYQAVFYMKSYEFLSNKLSIIAFLAGFIASANINRDLLAN